MSNLLDNIYVEYPVKRLIQLLDSAIANTKHDLNEMELQRQKNINSIESEYSSRTWLYKFFTCKPEIDWFDDVKIDKKKELIKEFTKMKSSLKESEVVKLNGTTLEFIKSWSDD